MMAEMMATYNGPGASAGGATARPAAAAPAAPSGAPVEETARAAGSSYLNEVRRH
jgi:hypothetical protein